MVNKKTKKITNKINELKCDNENKNNRNNNKKIKYFIIKLLIYIIVRQKILCQTYLLSFIFLYIFS